MLLGEPPRTQADLNFSLFGIPVRVHPLFWLVALLLGYNQQDPASVLTWVIAVFVGILVHELGHALTMRAYGFYPWITLYSFGGLASYDQRYASRSAGSGPLGQILMTLAGPAAGFLLATLVVLVYVSAENWNGVIFYGPGNLIPQTLIPKHPRLEEFINQLLFICVAWGLLNLLPIYPLDGGQIAREVFLLLSPRDGIVQSLWLSVFVAGGVAIYWFTHWGGLFVPLFFGYFAFSSFVALRAYSGRGPW